LEDGTRRLLFHDGTTEDFDLVVGADGAWSRVRAALTGAVPSYSGVSFVEIGFDDCDRLHPQLAELTGDGMMIAKSPGQAIIGQRNSNGHIRSYIAFREPENWYERAGLNQLTVGAYLLKKFEGWHESLRDFIALNEGGFINRPLYALPVPHSWERVPGITLLGDAAHLMPPLGLGANLAMLDGTELAQALVAEDVLDDGVRAYESTMLPRSVEAAKACEEGLYHLIPLPN
jgi:2-polyprenyl-6-methoxyphenol hydroxylase-like FAD-dependent oxidoreductase